MPCCSQCAGIERQFGRRTAARELRRYRKNGPIPTTRMLIDMLRGAGVDGLTLLDIGGGVGAIQHELLEAGVRHVTAVDASSEYLRAARSEAARRGRSGAITAMHGDFVEVADQVPRADVVTLDRVVCCYPDMRSLVGASARKAERFYGLVFPRERIATRLTLPLINTFNRLRRCPFRVFMHPVAAIDAAVRSHGLVLREARRVMLWEARLYERRRA